MIFYATKKTFERYKLKTVEEFSEPIGNYVKGLIEREKDDRLFEWGMKLFYFDRRKCLVAINFASRFTVFLMDIKVDELSDVGNFLCYYLTELYKDDEEMQSFLLPKYLSESAQCVFAPLKDKSMISHLNRMVSDFALDGYRFYDFITHFKQYGKIEKLTRPNLTELVDTILVHEDGNITINFKFKDAYKQIIEYIEETKQKYLEEIA